MTRMPTLFIPHGGGPCFFMESDPPDLWDKMENYLAGIAKSLGQVPTAIVIISGHWEENMITVQSNMAPPMLFDYGGFPPHTYELSFPAAGSPELAKRIQSLLNDSNVSNGTETERGFDHGVFVPLLVAFPKAEIPVVQVSLRADMDPAAHIALGQALQPLRDEGVLLIGSGMSYHNLRIMLGNMAGGNAMSDAKAFDAWLQKTVTDNDPEKRNADLINWADAPAARAAHPREEHLLPLHVVAGAAGDDVGKIVLEDEVLGTPQLAIQFG